MDPPPPSNSLHAISKVSLREGAFDPPPGNVVNIQRV